MVEDEGRHIQQAGGGGREGNVEMSSWIFNKYDGQMENKLKPFCTGNDYFIHTHLHRQLVHMELFVLLLLLLPSHSVKKAAGQVRDKGSPGLLFLSYLCSHIHQLRELQIFPVSLLKEVQQTPCQEFRRYSQPPSMCLYANELKVEFLF